jgi:hypothetical protein
MRLGGVKEISGSDICEARTNNTLILKTEE